MKTRTFGWVQDSHLIEKLRTTVEVFKYGSPTHCALIEEQIPRLVTERDRRDRFLVELNRKPLKLKFTDLVGTAHKDICTGILRAALKGQMRNFMRNWPAENYLRWAHTLEFIQYDRDHDSFSITEFGLQYIGTQLESAEEKEILTQAFLSNPPVMRVLNLLADGSHLTKFEIGKQLGFVGEDGFTNLSQNILVRTLVQMEDPKKRNQKLRDWEGTSDKYVRTIASWLMKMGWLEKIEKRVEATFGNETLECVIGQAYVITDAGLKARRRGLGTNIQKRISKNVFWEMLATKGKSRDYIRTRRALILQEIAKKSCSLQALQQLLTDEGFGESEATIVNDLKGLKQIGLNVQKEQNGYFLQDTIQNITIPSLPTKETVKDDIQELIDQCREHLEHVSHEYLVLIELSFSSKQSRVFEMQTVDLLMEQCGFNGFHLGGANQPDGLIFTQGLSEDYGVIIDTKAYQKSFNIPASERRKMIQYTNENLDRYESHPTKWWKQFPTDLEMFKFLFVSGSFGGKYEDQLREISRLTQNTKGAAITSYNLLLLAEEITREKINLQDVAEKFSCLSEVEINSDQ